MKESCVLFLVSTLFISAALSSNIETNADKADLPSNLEDDFSSTSLVDQFDHKLTTDDVRNISVLVSNSSALGNSTHLGFIHGFGESISVIFVSEIGDKTFFIAAILAMRNNKLTVFLAAVSALFLMTVLSGALGWVVTTFIPREVTYYTCTGIMFLFGLKMLWEAWKMGENEAEEVQREVEEELARRDPTTPTPTIPRHHTQDVESVTNEGETEKSEEPAQKPNDQMSSSTESKLGIVNVSFQQEPDHHTTRATTVQPPVIVVTNMEEIDLGQPNTITAQVPTESKETPTTVETKVRTKKKISFLDSVIDTSCKENSWFGKKCLQIFKLFMNTFTMTFIAEWGDRSQLATIVLVGINDATGVILGGCVGHFICTAGAVLAGALIAKYVSVRKVTFIGALVFLGFAVASIFISPEEDGIEGIPEISGYDSATRLLNHNLSLTIALENAKQADDQLLSVLSELDDNIALDYS